MYNIISVLLTAFFHLSALDCVFAVGVGGSVCYKSTQLASVSCGSKSEWSEGDDEIDVDSLERVSYIFSYSGVAVWHSKVFWLFLAFESFLAFLLLGLRLLHNMISIWDGFRSTIMLELESIAQQEVLNRHME
jgi:hypothetical protein